MDGGRKTRAARPVEAEVLIVGAGMVGMTLAAALAGAGLSVVVIDRADPAAMADDGFDGRASAIAHGSQQALAGIGLWLYLRADAQPILDIRVSDGPSRLFLHYDHRALGDVPMGYMVENRHTRRGLAALAATLSDLTVLAPVGLAGLTRDAAGVTATLSDGRRIKAALAVAADGRDSRLRAQAGIPVTAWDYPQTGIVCSVNHDRPHRGVAHERFLPAGPFAVLPLTGDRSSLVWTERAALAPAMMALDDAAFGAEIERRFGDHYGRMRPAGGRWAYPLGLVHADRYVDRRLVLVGDAAHAIHPIAGQGLNMGLRDVAALAEVLVDARRLGLDAGDHAVLQRYERWRRFDNVLLMMVTDGLNRLFSNDVAPLRLARDVGLALVDRAAPLKQLFMRHAMGLVGDLPRLVRGEAL